MLTFVAIWLGTVVLMILGAAWLIQREKRRHPSSTIVLPMFPYDDSVDVRNEKVIEDAAQDLRIAAAALMQFVQNRRGAYNRLHLSRAMEITESVRERVDGILTILSGDIEDDDVADPLADRAEDAIEDLQTAAAALRRWSRYGGDRFGRDSWHFLDRAAEFAKAALDHLDAIRGTLAEDAADDDSVHDSVHDSLTELPASPPLPSASSPPPIVSDVLYDIRLWRRYETTFYRPLGARCDVPGSVIQDVSTLVPYGDGTDRPVCYILEVRRAGAKLDTPARKFSFSRVGPAAPSGWTFFDMPPAGTAGTVEQIHPEPGEMQGKDKAR